MPRASYVASARAMAHILTNWPGFVPPPWPTFAPPLTHGAGGAVVTVTGQSFHVTIPEGETLVEGHFTLDEAAHPKRIDWIDSIGQDAGKTLPAIYELADDHFRFAAADAEMERPRTFDGGQGITIRGFVRP